MGWESYISVTEDSIQAINLSGALVDLSDDGQICPIGKPIILPKLENGHTVVYKQIMECKIFNNNEVGTTSLQIKCHY